MPEDVKYEPDSISVKLMKEIDKLISSGTDRESIFYQLALKLRECWEPDKLIEVKVKMPAEMYNEFHDNIEYFMDCLNKLEKKHLPDSVYSRLGDNAMPIKEPDEPLILGHLLIRGGNSTSLEYKQSKITTIVSMLDEQEITKKSNPNRNNPQETRLLSKEDLPGYI